MQKSIIQSVAAFGFALVLAGCKGGGGDSSGVIVIKDIQDLRSEFKADHVAAKAKYAGKVVRVQIDKVMKAEKAPSGEGSVTGTNGVVVVVAGLSANPDASKVDSLKPGDKVTVEGEIRTFDITDLNRGVLVLMSGRIVS